MKLWFKQNLRYIIPGLLLFVVFIFAVSKTATKEEKNTLPVELSGEKTISNKSKANASSLHGKNGKEIMVDVKGAVVHPGVYKMSTGDRTIHAIHQAGGFLKEADERAVNLAAVLQDEMVIYVPKKGEVQHSTPSEPDATRANESQSAKINVNIATAEELQKITGIGPAKAAAIISYREENGPFQKVEDLLNVTGIGEKSLEKMKDEITIN